MADPIRAALERLTGDIQDARDCIEGWGAYASEYFQQKHDLAGDLAAFDRKIAAARAALAGATSPPHNAEGEVAELVTLLAVGADCSGGAKLSPDQCHRAADLLLQQEARIAELDQKLEIERMRVVACGAVAMADTPSSAAKARACHPDYWSASADDIARQIDELMRLRAAQQTPVPVSERLPGPEEMDGSLVWCGSQAAGLPYWEWCLDDIRHPGSSGYTHWLPANTPALPTALPLPQVEVE